MGTCPASSHVKASEVIRSTSRPIVYLEIWTCVQSPHVNHSLCAYLAWEAAGSFDYGFLLFPRNASRGQFCSWSAAICHCLSDGAFNRPYSRTLSHPGYRDLTSF